jgi:hypothetical protein
MTDLDRENRILEIRRIHLRSARKKIAETIICAKPPAIEIDISEPFLASNWSLKDYVTLDWKHSLDIRKLKTTISKYAIDKSRCRPLNIIMQAAPGSGKSHFVKCLAKSFSALNAAAVDFNMSNMQNVEELIQPLDTVRNFKVIDRFPILFLDEFDSHPRNYSLLLPLLWDGELQIGHRDLKLGKLVVILAGSGDEIDSAMKKSKGMHEAFYSKDSKLIDLLSRINGGEFNIPALDEIDFTTERDRRIDKVCLAISLIDERFGDRIEIIPWSILHFISLCKFRYGVRSIAYLIDSMPALEEKEISINNEKLTLPIKSVDELKESNLSHHLYSADGPAAIVELWKASCANDTQIRIKEEFPEDDEVPL